MGLGGKMSDSVDPIRVKDLPNEGGIADVRLPKEITRGPGFLDIPQIFRIPRIGKRIHIDNPAPEIRTGKQPTDEIAPDEAATPCHH